MAKVLLISDIGMTETLSAGNVLKHFMLSLPEEFEIHQLIIGDPSLKYPLNWLGRGTSYFAQKPRFWPRKRFFSMLNLALWSYIKRFEIPKLEIWAQQLLSSHEFDLILLAFQCPVLCKILRGLDFGTSRTVSFWWDHPQLWADGWNIEGKIRDEFYSDYFALHNQVDLVLAPSEGLIGSGLIADIQKIEVLYPFLADEISADRSNDAMVDWTSINIAYIGTIQYSIRELFEFVEFLNALNWRIGEREIRLNVFSHDRLPEELIPHKNIRHHGFLPTSTLVSKIARMDFAMILYPFEETHRIIVETSFPGKTSIYAASGLPILCYAPSNSSIAKFLSTNNGGLVLSRPLVTSEFEHALQVFGALATSSSQIYRNFFSSEILDQLVAKVISMTIGREELSFDYNNLQNKPSYKTTNSKEYGYRRIRTFFSSDVLHDTYLNNKRISPEVNIGVIDSFSYPALSKYFVAILHPRTSLRYLRQSLSAFNAGLTLSVLTRLGKTVLSLLFRLRVLHRLDETR